MQTIYFTSESERRAVLPDATEDEAWRERTRLEMPDDNPGNFAPVCDRIHLKASQESKVPGPKADFVLPRLSLALRRHPPCVSASPSSPPLSPAQNPAARNWGGASVSSSPPLNAAMLLYAMRIKQKGPVYVFAVYAAVAEQTQRDFSPPFLPEIWPTARRFIARNHRCVL